MVVTRMQADAGLIQYVKGIDQRRSQSRGQGHPLNFATGQGAGLAVKGQIPQTDILQIGQAAADFIAHQPAGFVPARKCQAVKKIKGLQHIGLIDAVDGAAGEPVQQGFVFEACSVAVRADIIAAVA